MLLGGGGCGEGGTLRDTNLPCGQVKFYDKIDHCTNLQHVTIFSSSLQVMMRVRLGIGRCNVSKYFPRIRTLFQAIFFLIRQINR